MRIVEHTLLINNGIYVLMGVYVSVGRSARKVIQFETWLTNYNGEVTLYSPTSVVLNCQKNSDIRRPLVERIGNKCMTLLP